MVLWRRSLRVVLVLSPLVLIVPVFAQSPAPNPTCEPWAARLISYQGTLSSRRVSGFQQASVRLNETFCVGDVLEIGTFSRAALQLPDQTVVRLDQGTVVTFAAPKDDKRTWLEILKGAVHIISRDPRALRVITPFANAGIEGTEFLVQVSADSTTVLVFEGRVSVQNPGGAATAGSGESVLAKAGRAPVLQQVVRPRDAVVWTLYFPPISTGLLSAADAEPPAGQADVEFYIGRAERRLGVGQVAGAEADLQQALVLAPGSGEVLARQSIIALTQNDTGEALRLADQAVAAAPDSTAAYLARSYARQARFNLPGALEDLQAAAAARPENALVQARLAEMWLATGEVQRSEQSARAAVAADPELALARTVLGFVHLRQVQLRPAAEAFDEAIRLNPDDPLPRLGRGLTTIRRGNLAAGRAEIENAVILNPSTSLLRSYVGKAYFDERRSALSASQFDLAQELDPKDPTPWFYAALLEQATNDPVGALQSISTAIDLNDNRAVYRSRLLLDADLAARSASQGRIYSDLGFGELSLREASTSINSAPGDYSGHRLLSDSYAGLPRYEIARVNELLQSQILQPLNMTPIPAQLGQANLYVLDSAGPAVTSFNEFNPLFNRNGLNIQGSAVYGSNETWGNDVAVGAIWDRWSLSLGQFHFETDGFRENNDLEQDVLNAFVQFQATADTSVLAEIRHSEREEGDLALLFDSDSFIPNLRINEDTDSYRLGLRHAFTPSSQVLAVVTWQNADTGATVLPFYETSGHLDGSTSELQWLYRGEGWRVTTGVRYTKRDIDETVNFIFITDDDPPLEIEATETSTTATDSTSAYLYGQVDITERLQLTLGASADSLDGQSEDKDQLNPKIGLLWLPTDDTTVRLAAFSTLQGPSFSREDIIPSLEPTLVSGFNQFFYGVEGEEADRYGIGVDHRLGGTVWVGAEASLRDVKVPFRIQEDTPDGPVLVLREASVDEDEVRAYLYATFADQFSASLQYRYNHAENDLPGGGPSRYEELTTSRVPIELRWFGLQGLSAGVQVTWVDQEGDFQNPEPPFDFLGGDDSFWVTDAVIAYRLPKRYGIISVAAKNLFDSSFNFQDLDPRDPDILPERVVLGRLTVSF